MTGSAYSNPQPYANSELERHALEGRIKVARGIASRAADPARAERWNAIVDELLDHLAELEARAASAALDTPAQG